MYLPIDPQDNSNNVLEIADVSWSGPVANPHNIFDVHDGMF